MTPLGVENLGLLWTNILTKSYYYLSRSVISEDAKSCMFCNEFYTHYPCCILYHY